MRKKIFLSLILISIILSLQGCLSHGESVPIKEGDEYYIDSSKMYIWIHDDGCAEVWLEIHPKFIVNRTELLNISIPYSLDRIRNLGVHFDYYEDLNFTLFPGINNTNIELRLPNPGAYITLRYFLDDIFRQGEVSFRLSEVAFTKELEISIHIPEGYDVEYSSVRTSPPPSVQTYLLSTIALIRRDNIVVRLGYANPGTINTTFKIHRIDIRNHLLTLFESLLISLGVAFLIFLGPAIYRERLNTFTMALRNNLRRRGKYYITLFGISTTVSLIASIFVQSNVIRAIVQSTEQRILPHIQPYMYLLIGITLLIGGFLVFETILSSVLVRKVELAVLKAIGFNTLGITKMVVIEGLFLGLLAGMIGSLAGTLFAMSPYMGITRCTTIYESGAADPLGKILNTLEQLTGGIFLLIAPVISFVLGKMYLKKLEKAVKVAFTAGMLNFALFLVRFVLRPYISIQLLPTWPLIAGYCILTMVLTLIFTTSAALYPSIKAGVTKPIEMMREA